MGRTPKPLVIVVDPSIRHWEEFTKLEEQGHEICTPEELARSIVTKGLAWPTKIDLWLGPRMWRMDEKHREYLDNALAEGRQERYPRPPKGEKS